MRQRLIDHMLALIAVLAGGKEEPLPGLTQSQSIHVLSRAALQLTGCHNPEGFILNEDADQDVEFKRAIDTALITINREINSFSNRFN